MKEQLTHILDQSVCLTRRQLRDYLSGKMLPVEAHAVEVHLASCPLCSMAMEGFEEHSDEALQAIAALNSGFLNEHFDNIAPQIHLNSMAPAMTASRARTAARKSITIPVWRIAGVAAAALLAVGIFWYVDERRNTAAMSDRRVVAMADNDAATLGTASVAPLLKNDVASGTNASAVRNKAAVRPEEAEPRADLARPEADAAPVANAKTSAHLAPSEEEPKGTRSPVALKSSYSHSPAAPSPEGQMQSAVPKAVNANNYIASDVATGTTYVADGGQTSRDRAQPSEAMSKAAPAATARRAAKDEEPAANKKISDAADLKRASDAPNGSMLDQGNTAFAAHKYTQALQLFQKQMNAGDAGDRQKATVMAAFCYAALGNNVKAQELLKGVAGDGNGSQQRAARRESRKIK